MGDRQGHVGRSIQAETSLAYLKPEREGKEVIGAVRYGKCSMATHRAERNRGVWTGHRHDTWRLLPECLSESVLWNPLQHYVVVAANASFSLFFLDRHFAPPALLFLPSPSSPLHFPACLLSDCSLIGNRWL